MTKQDSSYSLAALAPCLGDLIEETLEDPQASLVVRVESGRLYTSGWRRIEGDPEADRAALWIRVLFPVSEASR